MERSEASPEFISRDQNREQEIEWIHANLESFWSFAMEEHRETGRGALVVDTTRVVFHEGEATHPLIYMPQSDLSLHEWANKQEILRMTADYDPAWEFIAVILKTNSESMYRLGVRPGGPLENGTDFEPPIR